MGVSEANRQAKIYTVLDSEQLHGEAFAAAVLPDSTNAASSQLDSSQSLVLFCIFSVGFHFLLVPRVFILFIFSNSGVSPSGFVRSVTMAVPIDYLTSRLYKKADLNQKKPGTIGE